MKTLKTNIAGLLLLVASVIILGSCKTTYHKPGGFSTLCKTEP